MFHPKRKISRISLGNPGIKECFLGAICEIPVDLRHAFHLLDAEGTSAFTVSALQTCVRLSGVFVRQLNSTI